MYHGPKCLINISSKCLPSSQFKPIKMLIWCDSNKTTLFMSRNFCWWFFLSFFRSLLLGVKTTTTTWNCRRQKKYSQKWALRIKDGEKSTAANKTEKHEYCLQSTTVSECVCMSWWWCAHHFASIEQKAVVRLLRCFISIIYGNFPLTFHVLAKHLLLLHHLFFHDANIISVSLGFMQHFNKQTKRCGQEQERESVVCVCVCVYLHQVQIRKCNFQPTQADKCYLNWRKKENMNMNGCWCYCSTYPVLLTLYCPEHVQCHPQSVGSFKHRLTDFRLTSSPFHRCQMGFYHVLHLFSSPWAEKKHIE